MPSCQSCQSKIVLKFGINNHRRTSYVSRGYLSRSCPGHGSGLIYCLQERFWPDLINEENCINVDKLNYSEESLLSS